MTEFTIASFNVKNLIGPDQEYYKFQSYTPEEAPNRHLICIKKGRVSTKHAPFSTIDLSLKTSLGFR